MRKHKPFYRKKGKYADNRQRIVIESHDGTNTALPKPEILLHILAIIRENYPEIIGQAKRREKYRR